MKVQGVECSTHLHTNITSHPPTNQPLPPTTTSYQPSPLATSRPPPPPPATNHQPPPPATNHHPQPPPTTATNHYLVAAAVDVELTRRLLGLRALLVLLALLLSLLPSLQVCLALLLPLVLCFTVFASIPNGGFFKFLNFRLCGGDLNHEFKRFERKEWLLKRYERKRK